MISFYMAGTFLTYSCAKCFSTRRELKMMPLKCKYVKQAQYVFNKYVHISRSWNQLHLFLKVSGLFLKLLVNEGCPRIMLHDFGYLRPPPHFSQCQKSPLAMLKIKVKMEGFYIQSIHMCPLWLCIQLVRTNISIFFLHQQVQSYTPQY